MTPADLEALALRHGGTVTRVNAAGLAAPFAVRGVECTVSERDFQQAVIDFARSRGWKVAHFRTVRVQRKDGSVYYATPVQADGDGFPDLVMTRGAKLLAVELKVGKNTVTKAQAAWLTAMAEAGAEVYVWKPADAAEIERTLT